MNLHEDPPDDSHMNAFLTVFSVVVVVVVIVIVESHPLLPGHPRCLRISSFVIIPSSSMWLDGPSSPNWKIPM
ncbi:uncharacterized protein BO97DRAFT_407980 [Aspergillus homomorphus CBS 101889]|uniref:Transmembrane protein n=1 Tax=Aspergillus homomorphus (strain CBS 101889) TaxID=1450537 RepID=A0A395HN85_ASPHC|nr:hypothetical protein BO97DRAFT_407980 [Aspergillus homomorphus CBS 101889]RAL09086.1 hypothetical protein BO97DRAFT_407980 [Aspergillus homomorphus CBS 101889]